MRHILVDPQELEWVSGVFDDNRLVIQGMLVQDLAAEMGDLDGSWQGEAKVGFFKRWADVLPIMQKMADLMGAVALALDGGAATLHDADRTAVSSSETSA